MELDARVAPEPAVVLGPVGVEIVREASSCAFGERFDPRRHHRRPDVRSSSGDGQTSQKLLAPEYDERHNSHRQAAPKTCLLDDPDMGCLEQFGRED